MKTLGAGFKHLHRIWNSREGYHLKLITIFLIGFLLFLTLLLITHRRPTSDDIVFQTQIQPYPNLFSWLDFRYHNWSGRLLPDSFIYFFSQAPLVFWKFTSLVLYIIFSGTTFLYYKLFSKRQSHIKDYFMLGFAFALPILISAGAFVDGTLWVSGSMNYFWIATLALVGLYPLVYWLNKKQPPRLSFTVTGVVFTMLAASSQEQVGAIMVGISLVGFCYALINKNLQKKAMHTLYPLLFLAFALISLLVSISAPGNELRIHAETLTWLPTFYSVPFIDRVNYSVRWIIDSILNHTTFLIGLSTIILSALFIKKTMKDRLDYVFTGSLLILSLILFAKGIESFSYWFTFYPVWASRDINLMSYIPLIFWISALIFIICSPFVLYRKQKIGFFIFFLYGTFVAATAMVVLSPTMYASGSRVLYIPSLVLVFISYILLDRLFDNYRKAFIIISLAVAIFFISQYLLIALKIAH